MLQNLTVGHQVNEKMQTNVPQITSCQILKQGGQIEDAILEEEEEYFSGGAVPLQNQEEPRQVFNYNQYVNSLDQKFGPNPNDSSILQNNSINHVQPSQINYQADGG